jgi:hypothetical protein
MDRYLSIYMNDQLAIGVLWQARNRCLGHRGRQTGDQQASCVDRELWLRSII